MAALQGIVSPHPEARWTNDVCADCGWWGHGRGS